MSIIRFFRNLSIFFRNLSIKNKLFTIILLISGSVLLLASAAFIVKDIFMLRQNMVTNLFVLTDVIGISSAAGLLFDDRKSMEENVEFLGADPHIQLAYMFSKEEANLTVAAYIKGERDLFAKGPDATYEDFLKRHGLPAEIITEESSLKGQFFFLKDRLVIFKGIVFQNEFLGFISIESDLETLNENLIIVSKLTAVIFLISLLLILLLASSLQRIVTTPLYMLLNTMRAVSEKQNYALRSQKTADDELGKLIDEFNNMLSQIEKRDTALGQANEQINLLNQRLKAENLRMSAELEITQRIQKMVLPNPEELEPIQDLDIVGFMEPADEVGGDYYDVLQKDGRIICGIGDVTGHGLESGVLMLMVQMAIRTLLAYNVKDLKTFLNAVNEAIYDNINRMGSDKHMTLSLLDYQQGKVCLTGQHEDVIIVRKGGFIERVDTIDLGFIVGLKLDISPFIDEYPIELQIGDGIVLYTDGITEAQNSEDEQYGIDRLCDVISLHWDQCALNIQQAIIEDVRRHIGNQKQHDDITLLILKQIVEPVLIK